MLPKSFYHSIVLQMTFVHSTTGQRQIHLRDFEKPWKHMETVARNVELFL